MRKTLTGVVLAVLMALAALPASALVIGFDDIDASAGDVPLEGLNPYHGFIWSGLTAYTSTPGFDGFNNGIVSPENAAYGGGAGASAPPTSIKLSDSNLFDFTSVSLGSGYYNNLLVTFEGLRDGAILFSKAVSATTSTSQLVPFNFSEIDALNIFSTSTAETLDSLGCGLTNCSFFTLDNFVFQIAAASPPPAGVISEPPSIALAGLSLSLLLAGTFRRRKSQRRTIERLPPVEPG